MSSIFMRIAFTFTFLLGSVIAVSAQETASLPTVVSVQPTVDQCAAGAGAEGTCVNPTQAYLNALVAQALPAEQFSQSLADYVIALAALAQANAECNLIDNEVAQAIKLTASYALDPEQRAQLAGIGETIGSCGDFTTAAIAPAASPN